MVLITLLWRHLFTKGRTESWKWEICAIRVILAMNVVLLMSNKTYDVTLVGFDGGTDAKDHLVKWVKADSLEAIHQCLEAIHQWLEDNDLSGYVMSIDYMEGCDEYVALDGVDCDIVDAPEEMIIIWKNQVDYPCPYCGGACPTEEKYGEDQYYCDEYSSNSSEVKN